MPFTIHFRECETDAFTRVALPVLNIPATLESMVDYEDLRNEIWPDP
jgi:hypothetical protein